MPACNTHVHVHVHVRHQTFMYGTFKHQKVASSALKLQVAVNLEWHRQLCKEQFSGSVKKMPTSGSVL